MEEAKCVVIPRYVEEGFKVGRVFEVEPPVKDASLDKSVVEDYAGRWSSKKCHVENGRSMEKRGSCSQEQGQLVNRAGREAGDESKVLEDQVRGESEYWPQLGDVPSR